MKLNLYQSPEPNRETFPETQARCRTFRRNQSLPELIPQARRHVSPSLKTPGEQ
jgi:hypothetical protein